jgi:ubiquinone/menaquinone biosynthesis C-methylase UbiE
VDATIGMLRMARAHDTTAPLVTGLAQSIPFSNASFDCVSDITVVQYIPYELQPKKKWFALSSQEVERY